MANTLDKILNYISTKFVHADKYESNTTFTAAYPDRLDKKIRYLGNVLDKIDNSINTRSTGVFTITSDGGPVYGVVLFKYLNNYYSGVLLHYENPEYIIQFSRANTKKEFAIINMGGGYCLSQYLQRFQPFSGLGVA